MLASRLVGIRNRPLAVRESCCDVIANLALGYGSVGDVGSSDRETQAALTAAGAGSGLTKMLSLRNVQVGGGEGCTEGCTEG